MTPPPLSTPTFLQVTLRDSNAKGGDTGASARLAVVEPASLTLTSPSHADWVAVTGQRVRLQCHLWDALGNKLWIGEVSRGGAESFSAAEWDFDTAYRNR